MAGRTAKTLIWVAVLALPVAVAGGLYASARAATARRVGGPLWCTEVSFGSVNTTHPDLWLGCGLANGSSRPLEVSSVEVLPEHLLSPGIGVVEFFFTDLPVGCAAVNDDPRASGVRGLDPEGFIIPPGEVRGAFLHVRLAGDPGGGVNVYRLRVVYRCGVSRRTLETCQFLCAFAPGSSCRGSDSLTGG